MQRWISPAAFASFLLLFVEEPSSAQQALPHAKGERTSQSTLSINFGGGSVKDLLDQIASLFGDDVNIVVDDDADQVYLPPMSLKNVGVGTALKVMRTMTKGDAKVDVQVLKDETGEGHDVFAVRILLAPPKKPSARTDTMSSAQGGGTAAAATGAVPFPMPATGAQAPKRLDVISLGRRLRESRPDASQEDIDKALKQFLVALDSAYSLEAKDGGGAEPPSVKYHEESGLLMVRGTEDQLDIVRRVIAEMSGSDEGVSPPADPFQDPRVAVRLKTFQSEIEVLRREIADLRAALAAAEGKPVESKRNAPAEKSNAPPR